MFAKSAASLILLTAPVVLAAQRLSAPARPSPVVPGHNQPVSTGGAGVNGGRVLPRVGPARPVPHPVVPVRQQTPPTSPTPMATAAISPPATPVRPDPPLVVPPAAPAPAADPAGYAAVEFQQGQLTVAANNADLGRLLRLIGAKTGAAIEIAPEIAAEPVVVHLGPGSPNEVLTALLSSPRIDFIIMGSDEQGALERVMVRKRASFGREPAVLTQAAPSPKTDDAPTSNQAPQEQQQPQVSPQEERPPL